MKLKKVFSIVAIALTTTTCSIVNNYYLLNNSQTPVEVTLDIFSTDDVIAEKYVIQIDEISDKRIKKSTYKNMDKRTIQIDSLNNRFRFSLQPNEVAHLGIGSNMRFNRNVKNIIISNNTETLDINHNNYIQFYRLLEEKITGVELMVR